MPATYSSKWLAFESALETRGYRTPTMAIDLRLDTLKARLMDDRPDVVFNLVEAIDDCGQLVPIVTALLDHLQVPYTGASTEGLLITGNKILTKQWLRAHALATADWWDGIPPVPPHPGPGRWITKPVSEDASIGMDDASVVNDFCEVPQLHRRPGTAAQVPMVCRTIPRRP